MLGVAYLKWAGTSSAVSTGSGFTSDKTLLLSGNFAGGKQGK